MSVKARTQLNPVAGIAKGEGMFKIYDERNRQMRGHVYLGVFKI